MRLVVGYGVLHIKSSYRHICHAVARVAFVSDKSAGRSLSRCVSEAAVACFRFDTLTIRLWRPAVQPCRSVEDGTDSWNSTGGVGFGADAGAGVRWDGSSWNLDRTAGKSCLCALRQATEACLLLRDSSFTWLPLASPTERGLFLCSSSISLSSPVSPGGCHHYLQYSPASDSGWRLRVCPSKIPTCSVLTVP